MAGPAMADAALRWFAAHVVGNSGGARRLRGQGGQASGGSWLEACSTSAAASSACRPWRRRTVTTIAGERANGEGSGAGSGSAVQNEESKARWRSCDERGQPRGVQFLHRGSHEATAAQFKIYNSTSKLPLKPNLRLPQTLKPTRISEISINKSGRAT